MRHPITPTRVKHKDGKHGFGWATLWTDCTYKVTWDTWKTKELYDWSHVNHDNLIFLP